METSTIFALEAEKARDNGSEQAVQLLSYQYGLRLRHLYQIVGRNLQGHDSHVEPRPANPLPSRNPRLPATYGYYYTLHIPSSNEEFHSSEMQSTCNPNWLEMQPDLLKPMNLQSLKGVLIRLWFKSEQGKAEIVTSWGVCFSGLIPIGSAMPHTYENYEPNSLIFKLRNVFYASPGSCSYSNMEKPVPLHYGYSLPLSETKLSYTVNSLSRLHSTKRAQRQQEIRCQDTYSILEQRGITRNSQVTQLSTEVEDYRVKVALLRDQLETELDLLRSLKLSADNLDNQNQEKGSELLGGYHNLHRQFKHLQSLQEASVSENENLRYSSGCLRDWRVQLISQLPLIYPISQDSNGKFHVCGVHLPDAENYDNSSDVMLSVGLGYVAHILYILAQCLHVPLRYPIKPYGSQATITDTTSLQLRDTEREFPLYSRGKEKEKLHFNYGVFLLNKNIAQMRWYSGVLTQNLRPTLPNLSYFMSKLTQTSATGNQPIAVMPDVLIPPLLSRDYIGYEIRTPATLQQKRTLPLLSDDVPQSIFLENSTEKIVEHEDASWKTMRSSSDTDSPSEISPSKLSLFVREVAPLDENDGSGKFVFVDQVHNSIVDPSLVEKNLEERLSHSNGFSFSLDNGLNHIGGKNSSYYKIKDLSSCDDLNLNKVSKLLKNLPRGSDPSLLSKADIGAEEEEESELFKEQTTDLLRSWTEDAPSHYVGVMEGSSSERLEEVGVECHESFMCPTVKDEGISSASNSNIIQDGNILTPGESSEVGCTAETEDKNKESKDDYTEGKDLAEQDKADKGTENSSLTLSDFGVTEDMFLNDVAFRTDALARQNCSFKMSFSRQSTEDEYH